MAITKKQLERLKEVPLKKVVTEFIKQRREIIAEEKGYESKGVHSVYSRLNETLRGLGYEPVKELKRLEEAGVIESTGTKGGYMVYINGEMPESRKNGGSSEDKARQALDGLDFS